MNSYQQWKIVVKFNISLFRYFYNHLSNYTKTIIRAHEGEGNNCFSKIQLVDQKNMETKHLSLVKAKARL